MGEKKTQVFYLKQGVGNHAHGVRAEMKIFKFGDPIVSDEPLDELFPNKFQKEPPPGAKPYVPEAPAPVPVVEEPKVKKEMELPDIEGDYPLGEEVTSKFKKAGKAEVRVFRKDKKHFITDEKNIATALNEDPLSFVEVKRFIKAKLADDTPDEDEE